MTSSAILVLGRVRPDPFVLSSAGVVAAATVLPCQGSTADLVHTLGTLAIAALFFLQGARLSREAVVNGITHWRLHAMVAMTTFVLFPLVGAGLMALFPRLLPQSLWLGVLFVCALPTTVQSSIALTSIARGNVAGAICAATASNLAGVILTPLIFGAISPAHGGGIALGSIGQVLLQLLVPFVGGHLARPWIGAWAAQHRRLLAVTDRGSILLVVYASFSAAVVKGVWHQLPPVTLLTAGAIVVTLLGTVLVALIVTSRTLGFSAPDEVAAAFCGSQKSLVTAVPMANALFSGATVGLTLIPIMLYYPAQLLLGAWLARRYAAGVPVLSGGGKLDAIARCANGLAEAACAPTTLGAPARR